MVCLEVDLANEKLCLRKSKDLRGVKFFTTLTSDRQIVSWYSSSVKERSKNKASFTTPKCFAFFTAQQHKGSERFGVVSERAGH